jgi:hypothetical protein
MWRQERTSLTELYGGCDHAHQITGLAGYHSPHPLKLLDLLGISGTQHFTGSVRFPLLR